MAGSTMNPPASGRGSPTRPDPRGPQPDREHAGTWRRPAAAMSGHARERGRVRIPARQVGRGTHTHDGSTAAGMKASGARVPTGRTPAQRQPSLYQLLGAARGPTFSSRSDAVTKAAGSDVDALSYVKRGWPVFACKRG